MRTLEDNRHYAYSAKVEPFKNKNKPLVLQFSVRHEQLIDCGGAYIKLFPAGLDQTKLGKDSEYSIMFGPDICGAPTRLTRLVLNYKGRALALKRHVRLAPCMY